MKRYVTVAVLGLLVCGGATGFAASITLTGTSLGAGNATVAACNASASVTYNSGYVSGLPGYKVTTVPITSANACAGLAYRLTLADSGNASLGEVTGTLSGTGTASPDFSASNIAATSVAGISIVISG
jgi:hypothetical protein